MRLIKRYDNRKLYDTETSKTVTLKDISSLIRDEHDIKVIDASEKDITNKVLAQIFVQENLETKQIVLSRYLLEGLIKESTKLESFIKKLLLGGVGLASLTQEKLEQLINVLVEKGEISETDRSKFASNLINQIEKGSNGFKSIVGDFVIDINNKDKVVSKDEIIDQKQKEIEELKQKIASLEESKPPKEQKSSKKTAKAS